MSENTNRQGVSQLELIISKELRWIFREQTTSDQGIDAQVEVADGGKGTGRLIALQIKSGPSWFRRQKPDGWWFTFSAREHTLWTAHALPVLVVLVDIENGVAYWQRITEETAIKTGKRFKVLVPRGHDVATSTDQWEHIASGLEEKAHHQFPINLGLLPPAARNQIDSYRSVYPSDAEVLAMHLAQGRGNPVATVQALLTARPPWVQRLGASGWRTVAGYSAEHQLFEESAEAFTAAAAGAPPHEAVDDYCAAALNIWNTDPVKSAQYLDQATALDTAPTILLALAQVVVPQAADSVSGFELPYTLTVTSATNEACLPLQQLLARQAWERDDFSRAALLARRALKLRPDDSGTMELLAEIFLSRARTPMAESGDHARAIDLLQKALGQRRTWAGPTGAILMQLTRALWAQGRVEEALGVLLPLPEQFDPRDEPLAPALCRLAVRLAAQVGQAQTVEQGRCRLTGTTADTLLLHTVGLEVLDVEDIEAVARAALQEALADGHVVDAHEAATQLARLGVDTSDQLARLVSAGFLDAAQLDLIKACAVMATDPRSSLPRLRDLARSMLAAVHPCAEALLALGKVPEAVEVFAQGYARFKEPFFLVCQFDLLIQAQDLEAAGGVARRLLDSNQGRPRDRARVASFLAGQAFDAGDREAAEGALARVVDETDHPHPTLVWHLVQAQLASAAAGRAAQTLLRHALAVDNRDRAAAWLQAMSTVAWEADICRKALDIAKRFGEEDPGLATAALTQILTTAMTPLDAKNPDMPMPPPGVVPVVPADIHVEAMVLLQTLIERHGDATGAAIHSIDPEDPAGSIGDLLQAHKQIPWAALSEQYTQGHLPAGMLAALRRSSYATLLVERATGVIVGSSPILQEHEGEVAAAGQALDRTVTVDTSALLVNSHLTDSLTGHFASLQIPPSVAADIARARTDVRSLAVSPGRMTWDPDTGRPVFWEQAPDHAQWVNARLQGLEVQLRRTTIVDVTGPGPGPLKEIQSQLPAAPWIDLIHLAHQAKAPLWSDDLGQRRLARQLGIPSFGTTALLDALAERRLDAGTDVDHVMVTQRTAMKELFVHHVVDVPVTFEDLLVHAEAENWEAGACTAAIARLAWFQWSNAPISELKALFTAVHLNNPAALPVWQTNAMIGISRMGSTDEKKAKFLAITALLSLVSMPTKEHLLNATTLARNVASRAKLSNPALFLEEANDLLTQSGLGIDPDLLG